MKKLLTLITTTLVLSACNKQDCADFGKNCPSDVESHWKLIEVYEGEGPDGSYEPVDSNRSITILSNGDFISRGSLCAFDINNDEIQKGQVIYDNPVNKFEYKPCSVDGDDLQTQTSFRIDGDELLVDFQCYEGCVLKYKREEL